MGHFINWVASNNDKQLHSIFLLFAGPGTGKSRFLEEFYLMCKNAIAEVIRKGDADQLTKGVYLKVFSKIYFFIRKSCSASAATYK